MSDITRFEAIDLEHIDYDDVLQLYKGWKKADTELRNKNKQISALNEKLKSCQDSNDKYRTQVQALESVKELTATLEAKVTSLEAQNEVLLTNNKELMDLNEQAERVLRERVQKEAIQSKTYESNNLELETLRKQFSQLTKAHAELEKIAADEQTTRIAAERKLKFFADTNETIKEENRGLRTKLDITQAKLRQCDDELAHASEHLSALSKEISSIRVANEKISSYEAEISVLKGDISRLVHLLQYYPALRGFLKRWEESEGMSFIGLGSVNQQEDVSKDQSAINYLNSLYSNLPSEGLPIYTQEEAENIDTGDVNINDKINMLNNHLTATEFDHLKRIHDNDPYPIIPIDDETSNWVPKKAAEVGIQFLSANLPHAPPSLIMEFLRKMNKAWNKREARKIKGIKDVYDKQVKELKRQLNQAKPYHGVMAEKQIRRLKAQVHDNRRKIYNGHARLPEEQPDYLDEDYEEATNDIELLPQHRRRPCMIQAWSSQKSSTQAQGSSKLKIQKASAKKLLEASLVSLETLGRQVSINSYSSVDGYDSITGPNLKDTGKYPSETYLKGALWLGKNIAIIIEELVDTLDSFRTKHLSEIVAAGSDVDARRSLHRLTLLASSGANEMVTIAQRARTSARDALQNVAVVSPGDSLGFQTALSMLPIESTLTTSAFTRSPSKGMLKSRSKTPTKILGSTI